MRIDRTLLPALALIAACRRDPAPAPPRPARVDAPTPPTPTDAPDARPSRGLVATLMSCSPATRAAPAEPWALSLRFTVRNQSAAALPLRREGLRVTADETSRGDLSGADAVEGPAEVPARGLATLILRPRFAATERPPISVSFAFDSVGGINHPISFPIPGGP